MLFQLSNLLLDVMQTCYTVNLLRANKYFLQKNMFPI
jgi:hypothetical protein